MVHAEESTSSDSSSVPRGVYHYSDTDRQIETSFKVPDFEALDPIKMASDLMSSAMKMDTKRKTLAGLEIPFSLTGRPMSVQINGESHNAVNLIDENANNKQKNDKKKEVRRSDMSPESRRAFLKARHICIEQSADSCDEALDTFHRIRFGSSLLPTTGENDGDDEDDHYSRIIEDRLKNMESQEDGIPTTTINPNRYYSSVSRPSTSSTASSPSSDETSDAEESESDLVYYSSHRSSRNNNNNKNNNNNNNFHDKANNFLRLIN